MKNIPLPKVFRAAGLCLPLMTAALFLGASAHADITTGLAAYWKLDETTGLIAADATTNHHDAALISFAGDNSQWVSGRTNGACYFNAGFVANQYATVDDSTNGLNFAIQANPALTLAAWVRGAYGATQTNGAAIICRGIGGGGEQYSLDLFQNSYRFYVRDAAAAAAVIQLTPAPSNSVSGIWQHLVGVYDSTQTTASNRVKLYLNGQLIGQVAGPTALLNNAHDVSFGSRELNASSGYTLPLTGKIDDARIYGRALSAADVLELYQVAGLFPPEIIVQPAGASRFVGDPFTPSVVSDGSLPLTYQWKHEGTNVVNATNATLTLASVQLADAGTYLVAMTNAAGFAISSSVVLSVLNPPPDLANGLIARLKMDETTGLTAFDSTTNAHGAALNNFPGDDSQWVGGRLSGALLFTNGDFGTQYAAVDDSTNGLNFSANPAFSISFWAKGVPGAQVTGAGVVAKGYGNGGEQYAIDLQSGNYRFFVRNSGLAASAITAPADVNGTWQQVVVTFDGITTKAMRIYVNGQLLASGTAPDSLQDVAHEVSLGAREAGSATGYNLPFIGRMDDVRFYNRPLTPTEVSLLYADAGVVSPTFVIEPVSASIFVLDNYTFSALADGTVPITYQWRRYGTNLPNATNATLVLTQLQTNDSGPFSVAVTNAGGFAISSNGVLTVSQLPDNDFTTGLTVWWKFDESSGTTVTDSSIYGTNAAQLYNFQFAGSNGQWGPGRVGGALHFNAPGTEEINAGQVVRDDYVYTDQPIRFPYQSNQFTIACWIKTDKNLVINDQGLNPRILAWPSSPTAGTAFGYWRRQGGNTPAFGPVEPQRSPVPEMAWKHFAIAWDRAASTYTLFVNGVYATNFTCTARATTVFSSARWLLNHNENLTAVTDGMAGWIDDFRIYNRLLTTNQVAALNAAAGAWYAFDTQPKSATVNERDSLTLIALASSSTPGPISYQWRKNGTDIAGATSTTFTLPAIASTDAGTYSVNASNSSGVISSSNAVVSVTAVPFGDFTNNLIAHWKFDETSGLAAADSSGNGYNCSLLNFVGDNSQWVPGINGGALQLNVASPLGIGNNLTNVVITDNGLSFADPDNFSFSFWLKRDPGAQGVNPRIISPATLHWVLWRPLETSGAAGLHGVGLFQPATGPEPMSNVWSHFVCVVDRPLNVYSLYVNGARAAYRTLPLSGPGGTVAAVKAAPSVVQWVIGHAENLGSQVDGFRGAIDDLRVYNRQLNLKDVEALYQNYNPQPTLQVQVNGSSATLSWPSWATDFKLQSASAVAGGTWTEVTNAPLATAFTNSVTLNLNPGNTFYRLRRQLP